MTAVYVNVTGLCALLILLILIACFVELAPILVPLLIIVAALWLLGIVFVK